VSERQFVDYWDGPVVVHDDHFFKDLEDAVEHYRDSCYSVDRHGYVLSDVPLEAECCDKNSPDLSGYVERMIERYDENNCFEEGCFGEYADIEDLKRVVQVWSERQPWHLWEANKKFLHFRELVRKDIIEWEATENPPHQIYET
jgi:hypothetical protein